MSTLATISKYNVKIQVITENIGINMLEPDVFKVVCEVWCCGLVLLLWHIPVMLTFVWGFGIDYDCYIDICRLIWIILYLYNLCNHGSTSNSYTMGCPPVRGDNPRALASGLSYVQVDNPWYNYFIPPTLL